MDGRLARHLTTYLYQAATCNSSAGTLTSLRDSSRPAPFISYRTVLATYACTSGSVQTLVTPLGLSGTVLRGMLITVCTAPLPRQADRHLDTRFLTRHYETFCCEHAASSRTGIVALHKACHDATLPAALPYHRHAAFYLRPPHTTPGSTILRTGRATPGFLQFKPVPSWRSCCEHASIFGAT